MRLKSCRSVYSIPPPPPPSPSASIALYLPKIYICHLEECILGMHLAQQNGREVKQVIDKHSLMPFVSPLGTFTAMSHGSGMNWSKTTHTWKRKDRRESGAAKTHLARKNAPEIWVCVWVPLAQTVNECQKITTVKQDCAMAALDEHVLVRSTSAAVETHIQVGRITLSGVTLTNF